MKTATAKRDRLAEFINTCTDEQLIEFVRFSAQFGSLELVRKLMLVWVAPPFLADQQPPSRASSK